MTLDVYDAEKTKSQLEQYCNLMEEIKRRTGIIRFLLNTESPLGTRDIEEFCYLELRMICELIALGCIVIQDDIKIEKEIKGLKKEWHPKDIIEAFDRFHDKFYPRPGKQKIIEGKPVEVVNIIENYLTKEELKQLYKKCGEILHTGCLNGLSRNWNREIDLLAVRVWHDKIVTLLNHHLISLIHKDWEVWIIMEAQNLDKKIAYSVMKQVDSPILV